MKRPDVILSIIGGALVLAFSITLGVITIRDFLTPYNYSTAPYATPDPYEFEYPDGDDSPLATGEPASPVAVAPTECPVACFTPETVDLADVPLAPWYALGPYKEGDAYLLEPHRTASAEHAAYVQTWGDTGNQAQECFLTWPYSPIVEPLDATTVPDDVIVILAGGALIDSRIHRTARVFPDTPSATAYMAALDAGLDGCTQYTDADGFGTDDVYREPQIVVPDSVAAVGWVRSMVTGDRFYVIDLQRANMVIRTVGYSNGEFTDDEFRIFMEASAVAMGDAAL